MRIFKTKLFDRWARNEGLNDIILLGAVDEIALGLVDAKLGGFVLKKRIALPGKGKRGGTRTLLAYQRGNKAIFIYGFAKSERANINAKELTVLKLLAGELLGYSNQKLEKAIRANELIEIKVQDDE
jgi:hypothetical protein